MTRLRKAIAITVAAAAALIVAPMNAHAAEYGCSGNLIDTYKVMSSVPNHLSTIRLYYNASTGYNCAANVKTAYYSQFKHEASISLWNQDFREDASCLIRPQSLLGEKFVECQPTQPRAPGTEPPPELTVMDDVRLALFR